MRIQQAVRAVGLGALLAGSMLAQEGPGKCPPYPDGRKADASPIVDAIDTNSDGKITIEEFRATKKWKMDPGGPGGAPPAAAPQPQKKASEEEGKMDLRI